MNNQQLIDDNLFRLLKSMNIYEHQIDKVCLSRDEHHLIIFVNSLTWTKMELNQLRCIDRFCRMDFIGKDKIALRFKKEGV